MVYEPLDATDRVLCWTMLPQSSATSPSRRLIEDAETRDEVAQCFMAQRDLGTLNDRPWTKEWLDAAIALCLAQPTTEPLASLLAAFRPGSAAYERLLAGCGREEVVAKFRGLERLRRRNEVQYEVMTGASRRLLELVCSSEVTRLRSRPGPFDWLQALRQKKLIAFDGGGIRSKELKRTLFLLAGMRVIQAVRRHFAETQKPLPVVLVLEEAGATGLVTPFVLSALQELRKAGLAIHVITQSHLDFDAPSVVESILANTPWQAWYQCLSPADQELGAKALANATFDPHAVHFMRMRPVSHGSHPVMTESHGETVDEHTGHRRHDRRTGTTFVTAYREHSEPAYKSPQLHEQEVRTKLATLRVGERVVRDRRGVHFERVRRLKWPFLSGWSDARTQEAIDRLRRQSIYLPVNPDVPPPAVVPLPDAAERLRNRAFRPVPHPGDQVGMSANETAPVDPLPID